MCRWCGQEECRDGERCNHWLLGTNVYQRVIRRIHTLTGGTYPISGGALWNGQRPPFVVGVQPAILGAPQGGKTCALCGGTIQGVHGHADHKTPWRDHVNSALTEACEEAGRTLPEVYWLPDDFVRVIASDPHNLQPTHARCNEQKSDSTPGRPAGTDRAERRAAEQDAARRRRAEEEEKWRQIREAWRASGFGCGRGGGKDPDDEGPHRGRERDPDPDGDGMGMLV